MRFFPPFCRPLTLIVALSATLYVAQAQDFLSCAETSIRTPSLTTSPVATALNAISWPKAQKIFSTLVAEYRRRDYAAPEQLHLAINHRPNAYVRNATSIVLTSSLLESLEGTAQLSFVLAHEIAHVALHHSRETSSAMEERADALAILILNNLHVDPCGGIEVLEKLGGSHPLYARALRDRRANLHTLLGDHCRTAPRFLASLRQKVLRR